MTGTLFLTKDHQKVLKHGIDIGDRSVGHLALETTREEIPIAIRACSLVLHDGGVANKKNGTSRMADRGGQRRLRNRTKRDRARRIRIRELLREGGYPHIDSPVEFPFQLEADVALALRNTSLGKFVSDRDEIVDARFPWFARASLLEPVADPKSMRLLFAISVLHIDRHRGWRDPWQTTKSLVTSAKPSEDGKTGATEFAKRWFEILGSGGSKPRTYGEAATFAIDADRRVRPTKKAFGVGIIHPSGQSNSEDELHKLRKQANSSIAKGLTDGQDDGEARKHASEFVLPIRPFQRDNAFELLLMAEKQGIDPEFAEKLANELFEQTRPSGGVDLVGNCPLENPNNDKGGTKRAAIFLPAVQEWKIRGFLANVRVRSRSIPDAQSELLTPEELGVLFEKLSQTKSAVSMAKLEDWIAQTRGESVTTNLDRSRTNHEKSSFDEDEFETMARNSPSINHTNTYVLGGEGKKKWPSIRRWWETATQAKRESFMRSIDPPSHSPGDEHESLRFALTESGEINSSEIEAFRSGLASGRCAYSADAIEKIVAEMRSTGCDQYDARIAKYPHTEGDWTPPGPDWRSGGMHHPALQVITSSLDRSFEAMFRVLKLHPDSVQVEVSRHAVTNDPSKIRKSIRNSFLNEDTNASIRTELRNAGKSSNRNAVLRRRIWCDQQHRCAYGIACAADSVLDGGSFEIDHIVPVSSSGKSPRWNLAAVCPACNRAKGDRPLVEAVSATVVDEIVKKMRLWGACTADKNLANRIEKAMRARSPDELDLRSPTTTAQMASMLSKMIPSRFGGGDSPNTTGVAVAAAIVKEARESSTVKSKSRFDQRHHLMDALATAAVCRRVEPTLVRRASARHLARMQPTEVDCDDNSPRAQALEAVNVIGLDDPFFVRWLDGLKKVVRDLEDALERDSKPEPSATVTPDAPWSLQDLDVVAPQRPIRLRAASYRMPSPQSPRYHYVAHGQLHEAKPQRANFRPLRESWTEEQIQRIGDPCTYLAMLRLSRATDWSLPRDDHREVTTLDGQKLLGDTRLAIAPKGTNESVPGMILLRDQFYSPGTVHHVRVFQVENGATPLLAFLPVYLYDVVEALRALPATGTTDRRSTHVPLSLGAISFRARKYPGSKHLHHAILENARVKQIGWFAKNDELWVDDLEDIGWKHKKDAHPSWLNSHRFFISSTPAKDNRISVAPLLLGEPDRQGPPKELSGLGSEQQPAKKNKPQARITLGERKIGETRRAPFTIVRRDALGRVRTAWRPQV